MTGFKSKRAAAQDKLEQWDNEAFNEWWDSDSDGGSANPFSDDTFAYWAWAGWQAALAQPAQETKSVTYKEVADTMNALRKGNFSQKAAAEEVGKLKLYTAPSQRPLVGLTENDWKEIEDMPDVFDQGVAWCLARLKERNA
jgi:hypothetical protein